MVPLALALGLIAGEISLQILVRLGLIPSHASRYINQMHDDVLRTRLPIGIYPEINSRGYRNDRTPEHVEIVALGDSQTYGYNVGSDDTWPKRLQKLMGEYVYNMGIGGCGPAQYYHLLGEALKMTPSYVIVATPLDNDFMDTCHIFHVPYWKDFARDRDLDIRHCDFRKRPAGLTSASDATARS